MNLHIFEDNSRPSDIEVLQIEIAGANNNQMNSAPINHILELKALWTDIPRIQNLPDHVIEELRRYVLASDSSPAFLTILDNEIERRDEVKDWKQEEERDNANDEVNIEVSQIDSMIFYQKVYLYILILIVLTLLIIWCNGYQHCGEWDWLAIAASLLGAFTSIVIVCKLVALYRTPCPEVPPRTTWENMFQLKARRVEDIPASEFDRDNYPTIN